MLRHGIELEISDKLSEYNQQLIKKYWECEKKTLRYKYSIQSLTNRYKFCNEDECEKYVARHSSAIITDERICCSSCGRRIIVKLRQELNIAFEKGFKFELDCRNCMDLSIDEIAKNVIDSIENIIHLEYNFLFKNRELSLTYLEKIYLYLISLKCQVNEYGKLKKEIWQDMFITERADKNFLIKSLYDKRVMFNTKKNDEIIKIINENSKFFLKKSHLIDLEFRNKYQKYRYLFLEENTFLNFDLNYESFNHMFEELRNQFDYYELDYLDIKEIREFILEQKIIDAYQLISNIQKYRPIPIEKSIELDCVLVELVEKYNLLVVNSLLSYQADKVALRLYNLEHAQQRDRDPYFVNKMFITRITSYLEYCKLNNKIPSHIRGIGPNWSYTSLEYFVSKSIINEGLSWTTFSGDELIHKWLNSEKVTIKLDL